MGGSGGMGGTPGAIYEQDFESLVMDSPSALSDDDWFVFGNVLDPTTGDNIGFYGAFVAPNSSAPTTPDAFSGIVSGEGGAGQGAQQLSIFSDYQNQTQMVAGNLVEANTFQERTITADDIGKTVTFSFDAKRGNIADSSTANAFIKTLDGDDQTNFVPEDTTSIPDTWANYEVSLALTSPLLEGQKLQFGFSATATNNEPSGNFYDNLLVVIE